MPRAALVSARSATSMIFASSCAGTTITARGVFPGPGASPRERGTPARISTANQPVRKVGGRIRSHSSKVMDGV